jgi:hypothetical protein
MAVVAATTPTHATATIAHNTFNLNMTFSSNVIDTRAPAKYSVAIARCRFARVSRARRSLDVRPMGLSFALWAAPD